MYLDSLVARGLISPDAMANLVQKVGDIGPKPPLDIPTLDIPTVGKPRVDAADFSGSVMSRGAAAARLKSAKPANQNASRKEIIESLPPPKSFMDRIWDNYAKRMTPDEFLESEPLWGGAKNLSEASGISESEAFAQIANEIFGRMGANRYMTPQNARSYIGRARGIGAVNTEE